jgi:membrane protein
VLRGREWVRRILQFAVVVGEGIYKDLILLRASALTYYSILALIPLLAIAVAILGALGVGEDLARLVVDQIAVASPEAGEQILELVDRVDFGALGTLGAAVLFATTVLGISSIERSLNTVWGVARERPWERRVPDYLAVIVIAPLLLGVAVSLGTTLRSDVVVSRLLEIPGFQTLFDMGLRQAPLVFLWLGFAFLYWFLPNTRVRPLSALLGGVVAAVLFSLGQWGYVRFSVGAARSSALFGGFAALPLLLVWIYISWVIVLLGAEVAFAHQNVVAIGRARRGEDPNPAAREVIGVAIATRIARAFRGSGEAVDAQELGEALGVSERAVRSIVADLERAHIVAPHGDVRRDAFQLGRSAERIRVRDVLDALRGPRQPSAPRVRIDEHVQRLLAEMDQEAEKALADRTLADLADEESR